MGCGFSQDGHFGFEDLHYDEQTKIHGTGSAAPFGQAMVREAAIERKRVRPSDSFELPEGDFIDGQLGITEEATIEALMNNLQDDELYCDDEFPADNSSILAAQRRDDDIVWMRPHELVSEPQVFTGNVSRVDVIQGSLGDCWFLSSCAAIARQPKLIQRVIPVNQDLYGSGYTGLVVCRFWRFGEWISVCIDDRLPTKEGFLMFARCTDPNEFWVALLEKAYAKLHGSYEAMEGGQSMDAMVDLTGGLAERFDMDDTPDRKKLYRHMWTALRNGAFITASRRGDWRNATKTDENGLVEGHAYTVSGVAPVLHDDLGQIELIRVRNPWGKGHEWKGEWSVGDDIWDGVAEEDRDSLSVTSLVQGEFWMSYEDFCEQFEEVSICNIGPDFDDDGTVDAVGEVRAIRGEWIVGDSAGGSRNDFENFASNPQFLLTVADDGSGAPVSILLGLMQEHRLSVRNVGIKMYQIGFVVYKTDRPDRRLGMEYFYHNYEVGSSGTYINYREVLARMELEPGNYIIIPATFQPECPGQFMVRVYSPKHFRLSGIY